MRIRSTNNLKGGGTNVAIYPLCVLFVLCTLFCALDTAQTLFIVCYRSFGFYHRSDHDTFQLRYESSLIPGVGVTSYNMNITNTVIYCLITFIAQGVLVCAYRLEGSLASADSYIPKDSPMLAYVR